MQDPDQPHPQACQRLGVDPFVFTDIAMREYHFELWKLQKEQFRPSANVEQGLLLEAICEAVGNRKLECSPAFEAAPEGLVELALIDST